MFGFEDILNNKESRSFSVLCIGKEGGSLYMIKKSAFIEKMYKIN